MVDKYVGTVLFLKPVTFSGVEIEWMTVYLDNFTEQTFEQEFTVLLTIGNRVL